MYRPIAWFTTAIIMAIALQSLGQDQPTADAEDDSVSYAPRFDYTPPADTSSASRPDFAIAYAVPVFAELQKKGWLAEGPFKLFAEGISKDLEELLTARRYTVLGPFVSLDEMTFSDKKGCDVLLIPELSVDAAVVNLVVKEKSRFKDSMKGQDRYRYSGTIQISGRLTFAMVEPMTHQKVWTKSLPLPESMSTTFKFYKKVPTKTRPPKTVPVSQPEVISAIAPALDSFHEEAMRTLYRYLDPDEMQQVKQATDELKARKVF